MEFFLAYGGHNYKHGFNHYLTPLTMKQSNGSRVPDYR